MVTGEEGFAGHSPEQVLIDSRYNDERVLLACKRVLDKTISPLRLEPQDTPNLVPIVFLLTRVKMSAWVPAGLFLFLFFGTVLLSLGPSFFEKVAPTGSVVHTWRVELGSACKVLGAFIAAIGGFIACRKLPLKG